MRAQLRLDCRKIPVRELTNVPRCARRGCTASTTGVERALRGLGGCAKLQKLAQKVQFFAMSASKQSVPVKQDKIPHVEIYWTAVTYRTVMVYASLILAVLLVTVYIIHPDWYGGLAERMARTLGGTPSTVSAVAQNQARFVNLDGKV